jgi:hypothetical protein
MLGAIAVIIPANHNLKTTPQSFTSFGFLTIVDSSDSEVCEDTPHRHCMTQSLNPCKTYTIPAKAERWGDLTLVSPSFSTK